MDAVEFLKETKRYCNNRNCMKCELNTEFDECGLYNKTSKFNEKFIVLFIEQWSQSHPQKTMIQDFFEKFPNAPKIMLGFLYPCAKDLGYSKLESCSFGLKNTPGAMCTECWSRPLEES